jgi:hypothetical protein
VARILHCGWVIHWFNHFTTFQELPMRGWPAVLVTISSLLVAHGALAQETHDPEVAPPAALPALPQAAPAPVPVMLTPMAPTQMVSVTGPATVDCGSVRIEMRCPRMELAPPTLARRPKTRWYGWQTLITDGTSIAMLVGGAGTKEPGTWIALSGLTYALGGPIVHWAHGNGGKGAASLGLRLGLPVGLGFVGYGLGSAMSGGSGYGGAIMAGLGFVLGFPAAIAIDSAALAREDVEDDEGADGAQAKVEPKRPAFQMAPDLQTSHTGAQVGVRGTF